MQRKEGEALWACYAERWRALEAMETERFGPGPWRIEYRQGREPFGWCLIWLRWESATGDPESLRALTDQLDREREEC